MDNIGLIPKNVAVGRPIFLAWKEVAIETDAGGTPSVGNCMLEVGIGMAYVPVAQAKPGTELTIDVRGNPRAARVVKKPIYKRED